MRITYSKHLINGMMSTIVSKCIPYLQSFGRRLLVHLLTIIFGLISVILQLIRPGLKNVVQVFFSPTRALRVTILDLNKKLRLFWGGLCSI